MPSAEELTAAFKPLAAKVSELDLRDVTAAEAALNEAFPLTSLTAVEALAKAAQAEGWLTPRRGGAELTFGRLAKSTADTHDHSIDVVDMAGEGMEHTHPNGEVSLCFVQQGEPEFCGNPPGWVVVPPGSHHTPTVTGGRMLIFYFLPGGAMKFGPREG